MLPTVRDAGGSVVFTSVLCTVAAVDRAGNGLPPALVGHWILFLFFIPLAVLSQVGTEVGVLLHVHGPTGSMRLACNLAGMVPQGERWGFAGCLPSGEDRTRWGFRGEELHGL